VLTAFAPGRVNLIGEHTDHTGGLCLPMAIQLGTTVVGEAGGDVVRLRSAGHDGTAEIPLDVDDPARFEPPWARYVAGVVAVLGPSIGFDGEVSSTLPIGAGLSSSASLALAVAVALGARFDSVDLAALCQQAEQRASGVPCGILDPLACAAGVNGHALLLDTSSHLVTPVPVPDGIEIIVVDSGERRALADGRYAARHAEALAAVAEEDPRDPLLQRRARHIRSENERVLAAVDALRAGDAPTLGAILVAGHRSLAEDFEVSTPALDALVARLGAMPGVHGARLTGAGFGGCVVAVTEPGAIREGWVVTASDGAATPRR
jgi:galactokinase